MLAREREKKNKQIYALFIIIKAARKYQITRFIFPL